MTTTAPPILDRMDALADASRSRLLHLLEEHELTVSELQAVLQQPQSTVSRHLKILGTAGWVVSRVAGTSRWYSFDERLPASARQLWQTVRAEVGSLPAVRHDRERLRAVLAARRTTSKAFFSSSAGAWDALRDDLFGGAEMTALLGLLDPTWVVADLGCGTGQIAARLAPFVREVVAVDDSAEMLEAAADRLAGLGNVEIRRGELEALPAKNGEFDIAVLSLVLHHLPDPARVLSEVRRALRPGGKVLIVDMLPHDREEYRREMGHVWQGFAEPELETLTEAAGLTNLGYRPLPADPAASGPTLFAATATAPV